MENIVLIGTILLIHISAWLTPGPLFVLIVRNSLAYSRSAGIWTAAGIAIGNVIHVVYSVIILMSVIAASDIALTVIKYLGAGYLAYLGLKTIFLRSAEEKGSVEKETADVSLRNAFKTGLMVSVFSPLAPPFFLSIFAGVLASSPPMWVVIFLMFAMPLNSFIMASILALFFSHALTQSIYSRNQRIVNRLLGTALILFAALVVLR